jgi:tripartite-type tricarboxylate transporter receptor subunit TctC
VQALLTGAVDYTIDGVSSSLPLIKAGKFRPLAKLNDRPLPALPDVPPLSEAAGMPELSDMSSWIGLVAPAGTPRAVIDKLNAKVAAIYADRTTYDKLVAGGLNPVSSSPEEFDAFFRKEAVRWSKAFKESGIKLN